MRLFDYSDSGNGYKIRLLLRQLGLPFEHIEVDILRGESRTPDFLAMNPNGRIPVLEVEPGRFLAESNAILYFLAEDTPFLPADRWLRAEVLQWLFFEQYSHEPYIATSRFWRKHTELTAERLAALEQKKAPGYAALGVMERHLTDRDYFVGDHYSIADIALFAYTHVAGEGGFDLAAYPRVRAWLARIVAQPAHVPIACA